MNGVDGIVQMKLCGFNCLLSLLLFWSVLWDFLNYLTLVVNTRKTHVAVNYFYCNRYDTRPFPLMLTFND